MMATGSKVKPKASLRQTAQSGSWLVAAEL
jgi:hypothetical protein